MGRCVIQLDGKLMEWTSVSDGPASLLLTEEQFRRYWREEYGRCRWHELAEILITVQNHGTSAMGHTVNEIIRRNRAGDNGKKLTEAEIIKAYTPTAEEFEDWCKNRDRYAEEQYVEWHRRFTERNRR